VAHKRHIRAARFSSLHKKRARGVGPPSGLRRSAPRSGETQSAMVSSVARAPPTYMSCRGPWNQSGPRLRIACSYCTELVAEPTMISPVVVSTPGRQPNNPQPPPETVCSTTWIMFTVMPLDVTPSPVKDCSFNTA